MARRFVLVPGVGARQHRYIIAEIVSDPIDPGDIVAREFAGPEATVLSHDELMADPEGRMALRAWESGDDSHYETDERLLAFGGPLLSGGLRSAEDLPEARDLELIHARYRQAFLLAERLTKRNSRLRGRMSLLLAQMTSIRAENKRVLEMNRHARTPRPADNIIPIARGRRAG